jgi:hypothetical protein
VRAGLFGTKESFVPLAEARVSGDRISVQYDKAFVKDAPNIDEGGHLSEDQEQELYAYYNCSNDDRDDTTAGSPDWVRRESGFSRADYRRCNDRVRGATQRRHRAARSRPGAAAEVRGHRERTGAARGGARRARADNRAGPARHRYRYRTASRR